jgi:hypothetical protein
LGVHVSPLPSLDGAIEINALEFNGVELLVEVSEDGEHNITLGQSGRSTDRSPAPAIESMALRDRKLGSRVPDRPTRSLQVERISGAVSRVSPSN